MAGLCAGELFPTKTSFLVFVSYMGLFINQGILVTASRNAGEKTYSYNTVTVVLLTECLKLVAAVIFYLQEKSLRELFHDMVTNKKVLAYYFIPASLYCLYNNLQFVNLAAYDPTTYYLLLQFRVVITGILFQILFRKQLSRIQWLSLVLLTVGCVIKEMHHRSGEAATSTDKSWWSYIDSHLILIMVQVLSSCGAGVYNEFLLKVTGFEVHIMVQNVFMYLNSIVCNLVALAIRGQLTGAFSPAQFSVILQPIVLGVMVNNAAIGIVTSLFLRSLNSILKTFASALELLFTAILCWMIFGIPIDIFTIVSIVIVSAATFLYAQHPVVNQPKGILPVTVESAESQHPPKSGHS